MKHQPKSRRKNAPRRTALSTRVIEDLDRAVRAEARHFKCSMSWVIAVAVGDALGVDVVGYTEKKTRVKRAKTRAVRRPTSILDFAIDRLIKKRA